MERMNRTEFTEELAAAMKAALPGKETGPVMVVRKSGCTYSGLPVREKGNQAAPVINLDEAWEAYEGGVPFGVILQASVQMAETGPGNMDVSEVADYRKAKKRLFIRMHNREMADLDGIPHVDFLEFALTFHIGMSDFIGKPASITVREDMLGMYGVTKEQLYNDAFASAPETAPARTFTLAGMMRELAGTSYDYPDGGEEKLHAITTEGSCYGAAAVLYPGLLKELAAGDSLFLIPSSVHEFLYLKDDGSLSPAELEELIRSVNRSEVAPAEVLSDHLYYYDAEADEIRQAVPGA